MSEIDDLRKSLEATEKCLEEWQRAYRSLCERSQAERLHLLSIMDRWGIVPSVMPKTPEVAPPRYPVIG